MRFVLLAVLFFSSPSALAAYDQCFLEAAKKWQVPEALLQAVAKTETDGYHNIPEADHPEHPGASGHRHMQIFGVMGLRNNEIQGYSLLDAAKASGLSKEQLIQSPCANIEGAAALFAQFFAEHDGNTARSLLRYWKLEPKEAKDSIESVAEALESGAAEGDLTFSADKALADRLRAEFAALLGPEDKFGDDLFGGEFPGSTWKPSPNYGVKQIRQLFIVLHTTEGGFNGAVSWLTNKKSGVSSHYIIRKSDGHVKQLVLEENRAYHARCWNQFAIGIELEGFSKKSSTFTPAMVNSAAKLVKYLAAKYKVPKNKLHIIGHNFGKSGLIKETPLRNCNDHGDPGKHFPWASFLKTVSAK